eukprot:scaffold103399_cov49-Attheya_sp.AAC.3
MGAFRSVLPIARGSARYQLTTHQAELNDEQPTLSLVYASSESDRASGIDSRDAFMGTKIPY